MHAIISIHLSFYLPLSISCTYHFGLSPPSLPFSLPPPTHLLCLISWAQILPLSFLLSFVLGDQTEEGGEEQGRVEGRSGERDAVTQATSWLIG